MNFNQLLKEPFVQFLLFGAILFVAVALWGDRDRGIDRQVIVTDADVSRLEMLWQTQYERAPTPEELAAILKAHVKEEVLYREAMALNLADDDVIVRRRLVQKFLFLSEDLVKILPPDDIALKAFYTKHAERYLETPKTSFLHVYLSEEKRGGKARNDAAVLVAQLNDADEAWRALGDPFMLQREYASRSQNAIAELFGVGFAADLNEVETEIWTGPLRSAYGWHAVRVLKRTAQALPPLADIRSEVLADYTAEAKERANKAFYQSVRDRYTVIVEPKPRLERMTEGMAQ